MLVYFEPANMCPLHKAGLVMAPLPARKQLWEAGSQGAWEEAVIRSERGDATAESRTAGSTAFALAANGELFRLADAEHARCREVLGLQTSSIYPSTVVRSTASWDEWCEGMDGLGGLVMLAASMVA